MWKLIDLEDYQLITIRQKWFKGRIYIDKRAKVLKFQIAILEKMIAQIVANANKKHSVKLDFHILVTGDNTGNQFSVDVFAFIDEMVVNIQNVFNNYFSATHWGLDTIFQAVSKLGHNLLVVNELDVEDNLTVEELSQLLLDQTEIETSQ